MTVEKESGPRFLQSTKCRESYELQQRALLFNRPPPLRRARPQSARPFHAANTKSSSGSGSQQDIAVGAPVRIYVPRPPPCAPPDNARLAVARPTSAAPVRVSTRQNSQTGYVYVPPRPSSAASPGKASSVDGGQPRQVYVPKAKAHAAAVAPTPTTTGVNGSQDHSTTPSCASNAARPVYRRTVIAPATSQGHGHLQPQSVSKPKAISRPHSAIKVSATSTVSAAAAAAGRPAAKLRRPQSAGPRAAGTTPAVTADAAGSYNLKYRPTVSAAMSGCSAGAPRSRARKPLHQPTAYRRETVEEMMVRLFSNPNPSNKHQPPHAATTAAAAAAAPSEHAADTAPPATAAAAAAAVTAANNNPSVSRHKGNVAGVRGSTSGSVNFKGGASGVAKGGSAVSVPVRLSVGSHKAPQQTWESSSGKAQQTWDASLGKVQAQVRRRPASAFARGGHAGGAMLPSSRPASSARPASGLYPRLFRRGIFKPGTVAVEPMSVTPMCPGGANTTLNGGAAAADHLGKELKPQNTHNTLSTATNSLSLAGSSLDSDAAPQPLTKASEEHCTPQERHRLQRLLLSLQCSAGGLGASASGKGCTSLEFYSMGVLLGEGSFAKVRRACHKLTGQAVAIKTYERAKVTDPQQWKRIQQEVRLMERLNHPRVVRLFETVEGPKRTHLIMEACSGGNLCTLLDQILQAVEYLHVREIVHRDLKLENILLDEARNVKLVDFGFATSVAQGRRLHVFCGTPSYIAPEIIKRTDYAGKPVDIWSLGIVLYALLCGCFPFSVPRIPISTSTSRGGPTAFPSGWEGVPATSSRACWCWIP
eukprot:TRINITY_DN2921_c0_g1_i4.p1 TRINITY_DN2921_c0_g1~~TRINITY_DN2921_c0_g1_i4.p1  ORF type:complete len:843 (-),score=157.03 TRINITY_DN2921_c0_g1_i4:998-3451(-)